MSLLSRQHPQPRRLPKLRPPRRPLRQRRNRLLKKLPLLMVRRKKSSLKLVSSLLTFSVCLYPKRIVGQRGPAAPEAALRLLGLATRAGALLPGTEALAGALVVTGAALVA